MNGWTDGRTDGRADGRAGGRAGGRTNIKLSGIFPSINLVNSKGVQTDPERASADAGFHSNQADVPPSL